MTDALTLADAARALTGWTIQNPRMGGGFVFDSRLHDRGQKVVLGRATKRILHELRLTIKAELNAEFRK